MRLALALASLLILVIHLAVFYDQFFHPWEKHQTAYFDQALNMAKTDGERAALKDRKPRIEQTIVTQFGETRVDRCQTCHIAADDPRFKDHAQPIKAHPYAEALGDKLVNGKWERRHKFSDFGCTVCHDGQGRGLQAEYGHGKDHYWPDPLLGYATQEPWRNEFKPKLLGKDYLQANCAQCHTEEKFAGTPKVAQGRKLFFEKNCYGCHRIEGIANGTLAPDLSEVGKKFKLDYLWESLVDPRANIATSFMPKFNLTDEETQALVIFLKSRKGVNFAETSLDRYRAQLATKTLHPEVSPTLTADATATPVSIGETLVKEKSCAACHKIGVLDGGIAPDLSFEGLLKDETWMMGHFRNPRALVPDSIMPTFSFSEAEYKDMTEYLKSLRTPPPIATSEEAFKNLCQRCHGEKGDGNGITALYLDPSPRDFTKSGFMNSKTEERLLKSIKEGVPGTSMPAWGQVLNDDQSRSLLEYLWKTYVREPRKPLKPRNVPETNPVAMNPDSVRRGEQIFAMRCTGCHGKKADGKGPNSLDILPRPRNLRNSEFVNAMNDRRLFESILYGVQGTAMPPWVDYGMTNNEVGDLVNFIRSVNQKQK
ncbi:MAG: c-type cytochrome [Blastocatellia bacterium]|nr:c-type cytochrome [Blastocatellia bacterium]